MSFGFFKLWEVTGKQRINYSQAICFQKKFIAKTNKSTRGNKKVEISHTFLNIHISKLSLARAHFLNYCARIFLWHFNPYVFRGLRNVPALFLKNNLRS